LKAGETRIGDSSTLGAFTPEDAPVPTRRPDPARERLWRKRLARWRAVGLKARVFCDREGVTPTAGSPRCGTTPPETWTPPLAVADRLSFRSRAPFANAIALQADGKLVIAGFVYTTTSNTDFAVARVNADGSLDAGFSFDGHPATDFAGSDDEASDMAMQQDGKIVAVGAATLPSGNGSHGV
jgi:uncharacterized delta-60 repeat protein